jgi:hypothetical protein
MVPGVVPVALLVARTATHAVLVDNLLVYPTGFDFDLAVRRHPRQPASTMTAPSCGAMSFGWRSASPTAAAPTTTPAAGPAHPATNHPTRRGCTRSSVALTGATCGWGLPPPGPLTFICQWSAQQIPPSEAVLDAGLLLAAAARATTLWSEQGPP